MKDDLNMVNKNIKYIRKLNNMTQEAFATEIGIKRSSLGAYEEGRARPNQDILLKISQKYHLSLDQLLTEDLSALAAEKMFNSNLSSEDRTAGKKMRVLSITVDKEDNENIELVPVKARAGYLNGYGDPEYIRDLPRFRLPFLPRGTYRAFEIKGDSMLPLTPGSIVVGEYTDDWHNIKNGDCYVIISKDDGVVYKRVNNNIGRDGTLTLLSDNLSYPVFSVHVDEVLEIWKAKAFVSQEFPEQELSIDKVGELVNGLQTEVLKLQQQLEENKRKNKK